MKVCAYCRSKVEDTKTQCPHCGASDLKTVCDTCGTPYDGAVCPTCSANQAKAADLQQKMQDTLMATEKANKNLAVKTLVAVFFPFVGGYFLIAPYVKKGFRVFGIIWCALVGSGIALSTNDNPTRFFAVVLSLLPIWIYFMRANKLEVSNELEASQKPPKVLVTVVACVTALALLLSIVMPSEIPEEEAVVETEATTSVK